LAGQIPANIQPFRGANFQLQTDNSPNIYQPLITEIDFCFVSTYIKSVFKGNHLIDIWCKDSYFSLLYQVLALLQGLQKVFVWKYKRNVRTLPKIIETLKY
jgi:hypothetical protein